jgi:hypothetical protein
LDTSRARAQAGYTERGLALLQALVEINCLAPPALAGDAGALRRAFAQFWASDAPRIGDPGAAGFDAWWAAAQAAAVQAAHAAAHAAQAAAAAAAAAAAGVLGVWGMELAAEVPDGGAVPAAPEVEILGAGAGGTEDLGASVRDLEEDGAGGAEGKEGAEGDDSDAESDAESEGSWEGDGERTCEMCNEVRRARCRLCLIWGRRDETERFVC